MKVAIHRPTWGAVGGFLAVMLLALPASAAGRKKGRLPPPPPAAITNAAPTNAVPTNTGSTNAASTNAAPANAALTNGALTNAASTKVASTNTVAGTLTPPATNQIADAGVSSLPSVHQLLARPPFVPHTNTLLLPPDLLATNNLAQSTQGEFERQLIMANDLRRAGEYGEATDELRGVLNSDAPDRFKRLAAVNLALMDEEQNKLAAAENVFAEFLLHWNHDPDAPQVLLRQGMIYLKMGLYDQAISKFYAVIASALVLKPERFREYQRLVLQAQTEIAQTQFQQGRYADAAESFERLLKLDSPSLNQPRICYDWIRSLAQLKRDGDVVSQAKSFLDRYPKAPEEAEVRYLLASALKHLGRNQEALRQVLLLLQSQQGLARTNPEVLAYWQQRTGNEIANELYHEGDFLRSLDIYQSLTVLDHSPAWEFPVWYQIGLIYERLQQPVKAEENYDHILSHSKDLGTNAAPSLKLVVSMARWRKSNLQWELKTEHTTQALKRSISTVSNNFSNSETAATP